MKILQPPGCLGGNRPASLFVLIRHPRQILPPRACAANALRSMAPNERHGMLSVRGKVVSGHFPGRQSPSSPEIQHGVLCIRLRLRPERFPVDAMECYALTIGFGSAIFVARIHGMLRFEVKGCVAAFSGRSIDTLQEKERQVPLSLRFQCRLRIARPLHPAGGSTPAHSP